MTENKIKPDEIQIIADLRELIVLLNKNLNKKNIEFFLQVQILTL